MFTGIITDIGCVAAINRTGDTTLTIHTHYDVQSITLGASIACDGICLTVTDKGVLPQGGDYAGWFTVDASEETLRCTTLGGWHPDQRINLERALAVGDELGGHFVTGHVDAVGTIALLKPVQDSWTVHVTIPDALLPFVAPKGAITLNGVSLTVNQLEGVHAVLNLIPHTWQHTTFAGKQAGDAVNIEIDMLARYMARLIDCQQR